MGDDSLNPTVFHADTLPRRVAKPAVTFRFDSGEIGLSKSLLELLQADNSRRVAFANHRGQWYITRVDRDGFWLNTRTRPSSGICSADICNKPFVRHVLRHLGHGADEIVYMPVAPHQVSAAEIAQDPALYPYPFYRLNADQKALK